MATRLDIRSVDNGSCVDTKYGLDISPGEDNFVNHLLLAEQQVVGNGHFRSFRAR